MWELMTTTRYPVPARLHRAEQEIRHSRFLATIERVGTMEEATAFIERTSREFSDATHNCWAYVVGPPGSTERIGMSDNGEPHGTAGRPMLNVLLHSGLGDIAAVVTRYYGGTKLGTGGLVRAYAGTVQQALATLPATEKVDLVNVDVTIEYPRVDAVQQLFPAFEVVVVAQQFASDARYQLQLPSNRVEAFRTAILDATRGQARFS
jgi:uncharacterized YigZ family protein